MRLRPPAPPPAAPPAAAPPAAAPPALRRDPPAPSRAPGGGPPLGVSCLDDLVELLVAVWGSGGCFVVFSCCFGGAFWCCLFAWVQRLTVSNICLRSLVTLMNCFGLFFLKEFVTLLNLEVLRLLLFK